jgi:1-acyl-sn-glycerol-3-phosphate acyltransferase
MQTMSAVQTISKHPLRNPFRSGARMAMLGATLVEVAAEFGMRRSGAKALTSRERADWLQHAASTALKRIGIEVAADGDAPRDGLVVSNHLSYLDVLAYASTMPCAFVAKREVRSWPIFGAFATMAGTIYINRARGAANGGAVALIEKALAAGVPVVLFPEGTSSDGNKVLPFHSRFFEPAIRAGAVVTAAAIGYASRTAEEAKLAYHGEDVFGTHLVRALGQRSLTARVAFAAANRYADRKSAARATQAEVERVRGTVARRPTIEPTAELLPLTHAG